MQNYMLLPANGSDQADEWVRLGVQAHVGNNLPQAQSYYQQALRVDPRHSIATNNLSIVYAQSPGLLNEGLLAIERASMLDGEYATINMNRALMNFEADRIDDALEQAEEAVRKGPEDVGALLALAMAYTTAGMPDKSLPLYEKVLSIDPKHPSAGPNSCFIQTLTNATPKDLLRNRQRWYEVNRFTGDMPPHDNDRRTDRPLRVGYVGGDFKQHSAALIFGRVLLHHTEAVEMYLYSSLPVDPAADGRTKAFQAACGERWRDISAMDDEKAAALIREDKIDILVDLAGHTNGGRLALFTRKPAPVQVTAWGFAHGTGLPEIDYFLADPTAVPESERRDFAEKIIDLPSIVTMEEPKEYALKGQSQAPYKRNGYITYGSYARYEKMSDECLSAFAEIMRRVPDSKMQFKDNAYRRPYSIRRILKIMEGIAPERLLFSLATSHPDHMLAYQQADIILDPFWHGGGVVALEALCMGVPLLTLYGTQPSGRSASSVLTAMGRQDWVSRSVEEYINRAVEWAGKPHELAAARQTLRRELLRSPVVDGYVEKVEEAYRQMWRTYCDA